MHIFLGRLRQNYPEFFKGRQGNNIKTQNSKQIILKKCLEPSKTRYVIPVRANRSLCRGYRILKHGKGQ